MSAPASARIVPILSITAAVLAVLLTFWTLRETPARLAQLSRRQSDWAQLHRASTQRATDLATLTELTTSGGAAPLAEWLRAQQPGWNAEAREQERERINENWSLQRVQLTIPTVNFADLGTALNALSAQRPPWRAAEISLTATERGSGRASLLMEGIIATPGGAP